MAGKPASDVPIQLPGETWKSVLDPTGRYEVSDFGRVRSLPNRTYAFTRILCPKIVRKRGYHHYNLVRPDGTKRNVMGATLVLESFVGPRPGPKIEVRHLNGNGNDNRLVNLAWGTHMENMEDLRKHGSLKGEKSPGAVLTSEQVLAIAARLTAGEQPKTIGDAYGLSPGVVCNIRLGKAWSHLTGATKQQPLGGDRYYSRNQARGEQQGKARMTNAQVLDVKRRLNAGEGPMDVARAYDVPHSIIYFIKYGRTWGHTTGASKRNQLGPNFVEPPATPPPGAG